MLNAIEVSAARGSTPNSSMTGNARRMRFPAVSGSPSIMAEAPSEDCASAIWKRSPSASQRERLSRKCC